MHRLAQLHQAGELCQDRSLCNSTRRHRREERWISDWGAKRYHKGEQGNGAQNITVGMARLVNSVYSSHFLSSPPASDLDRNISQTIFFIIILLLNLLLLICICGSNRVILWVNLQLVELSLVLGSPIEVCNLYPWWTCPVNVMLKPFYYSSF